MAFRQLMAGSLTLLPAAEWRLLAAGDLMVHPGATLIVVPDGTPTQEVLEILKTAMAGRPPSGSGGSLPGGVPL